MGLRLKDGIENKVFQRHFGKNILEIFDEKKLENLIKNNLINLNQDHIKITNQGLILANSIIAKIIEIVDINQQILTKN
jgi:coproporphyrinogen III oxidase-like Fe-S oxidoreductase